MSGTLYWVQNTPLGGAAAPAKVATGTAIKSMLQLTIPSSVAVRIVEWGFSLDTPATASIANVELFGHLTTLTTGSAGSFTPVEYASFSAVPGLTTCLQAGSGAFTETTPTSYRPFDVQTVVPPINYVKQWPLGREPQSNLSTFVGIRVTASVTANMYAYIIYEE